MSSQGRLRKNRPKPGQSQPGQVDVDAGGSSRSVLCVTRVWWLRPLPWPLWPTGGLGLRLVASAGPGSPGRGLAMTEAGARHHRDHGTTGHRHQTPTTTTTTLCARLIKFRYWLSLSVPLCMPWCPGTWLV